MAAPFAFGAPAAAAPATGGFNFGAAPPPAAPATGGFNFGAPAAAPATGGFNFGAAAPAAPATGGFNFGAPAAAPATGGFNFGAPAAAPATGGFNFGAAAAPATAATAAAAAASQWQTKVADLPDDGRRAVETLLRQMREQQREAEDALRAAAAADPLRTHAQIEADTARLKARFEQLRHTVATDADTVAALKDAMQRETRAAESALYVARRLRAPGGFASGAAAASPAWPHFSDAAYRAETDFERYLRVLDEAEKCVSSSVAAPSSSSSAPSDIAAIQQALRNLHELFLDVAAAVAASHRDVEALCSSSSSSSSTIH